MNPDDRRAAGPEGFDPAPKGGGRGRGGNPPGATPPDKPSPAKAKPAKTKPGKPSPAKATPAKNAPEKAEPAKAAPNKPLQAKAKPSPAKAKPAKTPPEKSKKDRKEPRPAESGPAEGPRPTGEAGEPNPEPAENLEPPAPIKPSKKRESSRRPPELPEDRDEGPDVAPAGLAAETPGEAPGEPLGELSGESPPDEPSGDPLGDSPPDGPQPFRAGFVAILGAPNAGKSSLLNRLLGEKVAIVTAKPQTTRHRILGVMTLPAGQAVLIDTPGIHLSTKLLNQAMVSRAKAALADADVCLWLVDGAFQGADHQTALELVGQKGGKSLVVAINKADLIRSDDLESLASEIEERLGPEAVLAVSAKTGRGLRALKRTLTALLPVSEPLFDEDALTDQSLRALAAELVREAVFELTRQEIPYATAVTIDTFKEPEPGDPRPLYRIEATIHVERESQKAMIIGRGGSMLKRIGVKARLGLEDLLGGQVFLSLFVRTTRDWTGNPRLIEEFGYGDR